jgi:hypothetical protein
MTKVGNQRKDLRVLLRLAAVSEDIVHKLTVLLLLTCKRVT